MGTHITILEAVIISLTTIVLYVFVKTLIQHFKSK
jgi:hypothetical protein